MNKFIKFTKIGCSGLLILVALFLFYMLVILHPSKPTCDMRPYSQKEVVYIDSNKRSIENNWIRKNTNGWIEVYIEGTPIERGVYLGKLSKDLLYKQEKVFVEQIRSIIPSDFYIRFLQVFLRFFNRHIFENFKTEYQLEVLGESQSAPHEFDMVGEGFERMIYYHGAHDIGHALQSLALVGCSSFAIRNEKTEDGKLMIGRNFDFYVGDGFANQKEILLCKPDSGYKFMIVTWPGFIGCVSGMNAKGITVTLNAAKSDIPSETATPIAILGREILQYAATIDEAYAIAKSRKTFVSESLLIGSGTENRAIVIEKTPTSMDTFPIVHSELKCTNHYQSKSLKDSKINIENIQNSASSYRMERLTELMSEYKSMNEKDIAKILRDQKGLHNEDIGLSNEKAMNQLICHHSIIFKPVENKFWISTNPFQLGFYECYDLSTFFNASSSPSILSSFVDTTHRIAADGFLNSSQWNDFLFYKSNVEELKKCISTNSYTFDEQKIKNFLNSNPNYYHTYNMIGDYFMDQKNNKVAKVYYETALSKEINSNDERRKIEAKFQKTKTEK